MDIKIIDAIIILLVLMGGVVGFKEGVIKKLSSLIGLVLIIIIAFTFKNHLSVFFYENLPFFDFKGLFKGVQILNVLFYEMLAFLIIISILSIVYRILLGITGLIEKILKATVILSIPSKILGFVVGLLESYIWVYVVLFILTLPMINFRAIYDSKIATFMLERTPILSKYTEKTVEAYNKLYNIIDNKENKTNEQINEESMKIMLDYGIITKESSQKLIDQNKVLVNNTDFLNNY